MTAAEPLLVVKDLAVAYPRADGRISVVEDVSFSLAQGERVALVGESGSGKSVTARALIKLDEQALVSGTPSSAGGTSSRQASARWRACGAPASAWPFRTRWRPWTR